MSKPVLYLSMSLERFIAGPGDDAEHGGHGASVCVPTHEAPSDPPAGPATSTYVSDGIESAVQQAKAAAGVRRSGWRAAMRRSVQGSWAPRSAAGQLLEILSKQRD